MKPVVVVHGGAGSWELGEEERALVKKKLREAVLEGLERLRSGDAIDAVVAAVEYMEKSGVFNAGYGSVYSLDGGVYLDAGVMDGRSMKAGSVAAVDGVVSAVKLARYVLENTDHVIIAGHGAKALAARAGLLAPLYKFYSDEKNRRYNELLDKLRGGEWIYKKITPFIGDTVGAVALDKEGNMAAAVSTGGIWLKWPGRIGDSPVPGAGFWAENGVGAFCATGVGEVILMTLLSYRARNELLKTGNLERALQETIRQVTELYGRDTAGIIGIDIGGNVAFAYNTKAMARGWGKQDEIYVEI
ncbi:MAG: isoaspartyl peptidase/L-asparaginase [Pyrobaculum sp.]